MKYNVSRARLTSKHGTHVHRALGWKGAPEREGHNGLLKNCQNLYSHAFLSSNLTKICFRLGLRPGPCWGAYNALHTV